MDNGFFQTPDSTVSTCGRREYIARQPNRSSIIAANRACCNGCDPSTPEWRNQRLTPFCATFATESCQVAGSEELYRESGTLATEQGAEAEEHEERDHHDDQFGPVVNFMQTAAAAEDRDLQN